MSAAKKPEPTPADPAVAPDETVNTEQADLAAARERETQDGKGTDPVPPSDFKSFATEGVEVDENFRNIASEVLAGRFGVNELEVRQAINESTDYTPTEVFTEANRRLGSGAPSALPKPSIRDIASAVIRGEWGSDDRTIKQRLEGAGHTVKTVYAEVKKQLGG